MFNTNARFDEQCKVVHGLSIAVPSTSTPDYVSLKAYHRMAAVIKILNGATVTGSAITIKQATDVAGTSEKAVAFTTAARNIDCAATDTMADFTVTSDTFTTDTTNSKILMYVVNVTPDMLDVAGGFDCVRIGTGNAANTLTFDVTYYLFSPKYGGNQPVPSSILD